MIIGQLGPDVDPTHLYVHGRKYVKGKWADEQPSQGEIEWVVGGLVDAWRHELFGDVAEEIRERMTEALAFLLWQEDAS